MKHRAANTELHIPILFSDRAIFGERLDIHTGGRDLAFPHHNNEIAQCEACFNSNQWANYFLHSGIVHWINTSDVDDMMMMMMVVIMMVTIMMVMMIVMKMMVVVVVMVMMR